MKSLRIDYKVQGVQQGSGIGPNLQLEMVKVDLLLRNSDINEEFKLQAERTEEEIKYEKIVSKRSTVIWFNAEKKLKGK